MDAFKLRKELIDNYRQYTTSFMRLRDPKIKACVEDALDSGRLWPHPRIGLNPAFKPGGTIDELVEEGVLHPGTSPIFRLGKSSTDLRGLPLRLHHHQTKAIRAAAAERNYVLTTGTGSGKSLAYMIPIVDHVLQTLNSPDSRPGVKALVVYPMNALANSQMEELGKFLDFGPWADRPVSFERYTGQDDQETRDRIQRNPPDILLTNYVMLELILTRYTDRRLVQALGSLRYLVLDELHSYRGRQGADVALLVRRLRQASGARDLRCVGTSATLSTEGGHQERQKRLAEVGSRLFGAEVRPEDVIGETLERVTPDHDHTDPGFLASLTSSVQRAVPPDTFDALVSDPLSSWVESVFGVHREGNHLVRATPLSIDGPDGAVHQLAAATRLDPDECGQAIRAYLGAGCQIQNPTTRLYTFAFRLHQFFSRGDTVYSSLEAPTVRHSTLSGRRFVSDDRRKVLLPLAFCRVCGQDYYVVFRESTTDPDGQPVARFAPRDLGDTDADQGSHPGFLHLSDTDPWPDDNQQATQRLPQDWFDYRHRLRPNRRDDVPTRLVVRPDGTLDPSGQADSGAVAVWWTPQPFRFCLTCGVSYPGRLGRDYSRLTTLGSEGRSTATTIMSLAAVRYLREDAELPSKARKLLSFTDNRQDASLQAGHFNDFVQVTQLRSSLWRALSDQPNGLTHDQVPQRVFETLALPVGSYASGSDLRGSAQADTDRVLRDVLSYHLYRDLKRGWRVTQPNLEQAGLLVIEYESLDEAAADSSLWSGCHPALVDCSPNRRKEVLKTLLDWMRHELAIKVEVLDRQWQESLERPRHPAAGGSLVSGRSETRVRRRSAGPS